MVSAMDAGISVLSKLSKVKPANIRGVCRWGDSGSTAFGDVHYYNYDDGGQCCLRPHSG